MGLLFTSLALLGTASAGGMAGVDWRPFARGDLAWVQEGSASGTGVAEGDGALNPSLTAWAGPANDHNAWLVGFAMAWDRTLSWTGTEDTKEDTLQRRLVGSLRPSIDYRRYLRSRKPALPLPWVGAGSYLVIPFVRYEDSSLTDAEQSGWDDATREDRARIASYGFRAGGGIEVQLNNGITLGARHFFALHRAQTLDEDTYTATVRILSDTALVLSFAF